MNKNIKNKSYQQKNHTNKTFYNLYQNMLE